MFDLQQTRRAPTWLVVVVLLALYPWSVLVNQWFAANHYYEPLVVATNGLLYPNLQVCLPTVIVWLLVWRAAGLRLGDVGWRGRDLLVGVLATLLVWLLVHFVAVIFTLPDVAPATEPTTAPALAIGKLLGQLLGNALYEETLYRGFVLVQLLLLLRARGVGRVAAAWLAALGSALVFALPHIPNRLYRGEYADLGALLGDQIVLLLSGLFLAWVYLRTRNLWWLIGLHSLANAPTLLVEWEAAPGTIGKKDVVGGLGLLLTLAWPLVRRFSRSRARNEPAADIAEA